MKYLCISILKSVSNYNYLSQVQTHPHIDTISTDRECSI